MCSEIAINTFKGTGYKYVTLHENGKGKKHLLHRLIAEYFIPNPENKREVDHIDTDITNNKIENLRWVTRYENIRNPLTLEHRGEARRGEKHWCYGKTWKEESIRKLGHSVSQMSEKGEFINEYPPISNAAKKLGFSATQITRCCKGESKLYKGYLWRYT